VTKLPDTQESMAFVEFTDIYMTKERVVAFGIAIAKHALVV
tara:strand:- start:114364 stop:114486 length:123 start_codon:yes stop_codon:yes gene_type:complete